MSNTIQTTLAPAERERRFALEQAQHSGEIEGLHVDPATRADAESTSPVGSIPMSQWRALEHATALAEVVDRYLDPDTGLLLSLVGARTQAELDAAEGALVVSRALQLRDHPVPSTGDLDEFRAIHRHLFQDVYAWVGEVRTVDLRRNVDSAEHFLSVSAIDRGSMFAADELRQDNMLRGMKRDSFIDRLSYHYDRSLSAAKARNVFGWAPSARSLTDDVRRGSYAGGK